MITAPLLITIPLSCQVYIYYKLDPAVLLYINNNDNAQTRVPLVMLMSCTAMLLLIFATTFQIKQVGFVYSNRKQRLLN